MSSHPQPSSGSKRPRAQSTTETPGQASVSRSAFRDSSTGRQGKGQSGFVVYTTEQVLAGSQGSSKRTKSRDGQSSGSHHTHSISNTGSFNTNYYFDISSPATPCPARQGNFLPTSSPAPIFLPTSSPAPIPSSPSIPPVRTRQTDIQKSLDDIAVFVQTRGFRSIAEMYRELHSHGASGSFKLQEEVQTSWKSLPILLEVLSNDKKNASTFADAVVDSSTKILNKEVNRFSNCELEKRHRIPGTKTWDKTSRKSALHMSSKDITPEFLKRDVLLDAYNDLRDPKIGIPRFMKLIESIVSSPKRNHMIAMGVSTLLFAKNRGLRKVQSMVGMVLMQASVQDSLVTQFNRMGLSIGILTIKATGETLVKRAKEKLVEKGKNAVIDPFTVCYDNMQLTEGVSSQRLDSTSKRLDTTAGFISQAMCAPGTELPTRKSFGEQKLAENIRDNSHLMHTEKDDVFAQKIHKNHIRQILMKFLGPGEQFNTKKPKRQYNMETSIPSDQPTIPASDEPIDHPTSSGPRLSLPTKLTSFDLQGFRQLKKVVREWLPLQSKPYNEGTISGTIQWLRDIALIQLKLCAKALFGRIIPVYGDLLTCQNGRAAKRNCEEDDLSGVEGEEAIGSLKCFFFFFGIFHLRMAIIGMLYVLWRAPKCDDFAHLNQIILTLNKKGFTDEKKIKDFRDAEDLMTTTMEAYVLAWIVEEVKWHEKQDAKWDSLNPDERAIHTAKFLQEKGNKWVEANIVDKMADEMFSNRRRQKDADLGERKLFHQASELVTITSLYCELRDAVRVGRVGEFTTIMRLLLPYFAGSSSHKYTRELATFITLEETCDKDTWHFILDNTLQPARGEGFVEEDCKMEHLVRSQKTCFAAKSKNFESLSTNISLISGILDDARKSLTIGTSKHDKEKIKAHKAKKNNYDVSTLSVSLYVEEIISDRKKFAKLESVDLYRNGIGKLQVYPMVHLFNDFFGFGAHVEQGTDFLDQGGDIRSANTRVVGAAEDDDEYEEEEDLPDEQIEEMMAQVERQHARPAPANQRIRELYNADSL